MPLMRTVNNPDLPAIPRYGQIDTTGTFGEAAPVTLQSSNMQLSGIPDKLIVFVRKIPGNLKCTDTDSYATIKNISITFNNQAGLLSTMTQEQLYRNSINSGLNMSWDEFCGSTITVADVWMEQILPDREDLLQV
jgi:hypothetical protein